jgi:hypothetical protein
MEIQALSDDNASDTDLSLMLNFERKRNGATQQWLERTANGN